MRTNAVSLLLLAGLAWPAAATPVDHQQAYNDCLSKAGQINNGTVEACSSVT